MAEEGYKVSLNVYDLSRGLARQLSTTLLGKTIDGIWHTGLVVYGNEYYFGGGIQCVPSGNTIYGRPVRVVELGTTHLPKEVLEDYLREISPRYTMETYNLFNHNCNNFSNEVAQFLVGVTIPDYILQLPNEVLNSPLSPLILPMIQQLESTLRVGAAPQTPQFNPGTTAVQHSQAMTTISDVSALSRNQPANSGSDTSKTPELIEVVPSAVGEKVSTGGAVEDPLGSARSKVQAEITREFRALMASGTLAASEAAALATRKVMKRYNEARG